ncbi:MAG: TIGR03790 family protein, partial [Gammaproteobacteria bacterium]|nr:TIGR03790 family protein [Gammaproteobacteria bacterium]
AYALAWAQPYRVGCMSISAAFAFGFDVAYCAQGCKLTRSSPYYHAGSVAPFTDFALRPTMLLATNNFNDARALIDRGVAADDTQPFGTAYLLQTSDRARSVRSVFYAEAQRGFAGVFDVQVLQQDAIANRSSILFYFTGKSQVDGLDTLEFLPGAMADHLTSYGGMLTNSKQMSAMRWLEAGATGSYGTALEPCAFNQKFPNPVLAMWHYATGSTLLEAYWKSVQMPGQGNFIGEPLAAPYAGYRLRRAGRTLRVYSPVLRRGSYKIYRNDFGVERLLAIQQLKRNQRYLELTPPFSQSYRIERM